MKRFFLLSLFLSFLLSSSAQHSIIVQKGGDNFLYSNLDSAVAMAPSGADIYLPGGYIVLESGTLVIDKELHIIGVGHYPDSTLATGFTHIVGKEIIITTNGSNTSLEGFHLSSPSTQSYGNILLGNAPGNDAPKYLIFDKLNFNNIYLGNNDDNQITENVLIKNSMIRGSIQGYSAQNVFIKNNIIQGWLNDLENSLIKNNIFLRLEVHSLKSTDIENNIIMNEDDYVFNGTFYWGNTYLNVRNNIFTTNPVIPDDFTNDNNQFSVSIDSVLVSISGNIFKYEDDYHLKPNSPAIGAGTNGTDIGIYGGNVPYKEGAVPHNPHIQFKNIHVRTNTQGSLMSEIRVRAQDN